MCRIMLYVETIFIEFYGNGFLWMYPKCKEYLENILEPESQRLSYQAKFIIEKCSRSLIIENMKLIN